MFSEKQEAATSWGHQAPLLLHICSSDCKAAQGKAMRSAARSKLLPGSCRQISVFWLTTVPTVMNKMLWVIHGPRSRVGRVGRLQLQTPPHIMWTLLSQVFPQATPFTHASVHELSLHIEQQIAAVCLVFESSPRLCLFSLWFQMFFVSIQLS